MSSRLEDYALLADCQSAALVSKEGSIDWLCLPRFDSAACFAALLGDADNGHWQIHPTDHVQEIHRRYREGTMILETEFRTRHGSATLIDFMPIRSDVPDVVRLVVGKTGTVRMHTELVIRCDYGSVVPWVTRIDGGISAVAGPDRLRVMSSVSLRGENRKTVGDFVVNEGDRIPFVLTWSPSHRSMHGPVDAEQVLAQTEADWRHWSERCSYKGPHEEIVRRSLLTLKALTYAPTGGIVAAVTTSLPEQAQGVRNWDYRFCWLRDATFTLYSLMSAGYVEEARAWRDWLMRAIAGDPSKLQILYGLHGERRTVEMELPWLAGYEGARPVRTGNAASTQRQLDVYGEVMDALHYSRRVGIEGLDASWALQQKLMEYLEQTWREPDEGIWEVRGPRRNFTHSKVMAWVAFDRAIRTVEQFGGKGPVDRWRQLRAEIHDTVCRDGFDAELDSFVQYFGAKELDASLLMIPLVGFLPADDARMKGTVRAIENGLMNEGFVRRYSTNPAVDGLPVGEGAFLACSFWLADNYILTGRDKEARALFDRLVGLCNDVGLLSEEYDPDAKRLMGNFPQAFSHVSLVNTAFNLAKSEGPAQHRQHG
jgi:GH15 family glucan-1,4-alpha-glucosidase